MISECAEIVFSQNWLMRLFGILQSTIRFHANTLFHGIIGLARRDRTDGRIWSFTRSNPDVQKSYSGKKG